MLQIDWKNIPWRVKMILAAKIHICWGCSTSCRLSRVSLVLSMWSLMTNSTNLAEINDMSDSSQVALFNPETLFVPVAGYSQVAEVRSGKLVYVAGQIALDKSGRLVGEDDFLAQVEQVFLNLKAALEAAGGSFDDVVKLNYFCVEAVDHSLIPEVLKVRDRFVNTKTPPISTFVVVKRLVRPEWLIEVEAVAVVNQ
jgi:enamine deaminase RidA (YjgF/YER057c/UK114 family)